MCNSYIMICESSQSFAKLKVFWMLMFYRRLVLLLFPLNGDNQNFQMLIWNWICIFYVTDVLSGWFQRRPWRSVERSQRQSFPNGGHMTIMVCTLSLAVVLVPSGLSITIRSDWRPPRPGKDLEFPLVGSA